MNQDIALYLILFAIIIGLLYLAIHLKKKNDELEKPQEPKVEEPHV